MMKPRIRVAIGHQLGNRRWVCFGGGSVGIGWTPKDAHSNWCRSFVRDAELSALARKAATGGGSA